MSRPSYRDMEHLMGENFLVGPPGGVQAYRIGEYRLGASHGRVRDVPDVFRTLQPCAQVAAGTTVNVLKGGLHVAIGRPGHPQDIFNRCGLWRPE